MTKEEFNTIMSFFPKEFRDDYTPYRKEMIYRGVKDLTERQFENVFISLLERFNRNNLPTVGQVVGIADRFTLANKWNKQAS